MIPIYLSVYLLIDLLDRFYMEACMKQYEEIFKQEEFKNLNEESKKNILEQITSDYDRKDIFLKYAEKIFEDLKGEMINKNPKNAEFYKGENGDFKKNIQKLEEAVTTDPIISLKKSVGLPRFLEEFARIQMEFWANSAFCAKNLFKRETDYTISNATGNEAITPIDRKNTGELEFNTVYQNGLHQMLQIKENLRVKPETLTHTFLSHIIEFYHFLLDPEFKERHFEIIRKKIPKILSENNPKENSFRDTLIKIKIEIIFEAYDFQDKNIKKIITRCIEKDWNLTNIITFQNRLESFIPEDERNIKPPKTLEKVKKDNEEKLYIIKSLLDTITAFPMNNMEIDLEGIDFKNRETIARDFYLKCSTTSQSPKKELNADELLIALENKNLNYFDKEKIEQFRHQLKICRETKKPEDFNK